MSNEQTLKSLGHLLDPQNLPPRDAVHIAVVPVKALWRLEPGDPVALNIRQEAYIPVSSVETIGVVDPFLKHIVRSGEYFWLYLNPGSITSLTHHWTHPAFPVGAEPAAKLVGTTKAKAKAWIREYAKFLGLAYSTLMSDAANWVDSQSYKWGPNHACHGGLLEGPNTSPAFWENYEIATGQMLPKETKTKFFSCSC